MLPDNNNTMDGYKQNIPALKEIISERKEKAVETLSASYARNRLPLEEYERLVEYINKTESERELAVIEKIVAEYSGGSSGGNTFPNSKKTEYPADNDEPESPFPERGYNSSKENITVLSNRTLQGPVKSGSSFVTILGTERIVIRKADLRPGQTFIDVVSLLGDNTILVEPGINVVNKAVPVLGNAEINFKNYRNTAGDEKELIISGAAILGNITIKHLKD